ncbi:uncharacterized protein N0V89_004701 [Didymosphaeria variabile]|uniref:Uncharacterized protein n=1 Tax=Didymosphaeria variabile TaxID=1932322 RepID=A0A9W9CDG9_9PLEO|nr:uncharacterized protein N0V89_004701 [Didymosphaeria variabile]KAJ4356665.1 hypothetical protein N0V89_004701 [Didymosphaeria variabile]
MPTITVPQDESATTNYVETVLGPNVEAFAQQIEVRYKDGDLEIDASTTKIASSRLAGLTAAAPSRPTLSEKETETSSTNGNAAETSGANGNGIDNSPQGAKHGEKKDLTAGAYAGIGIGVAAALVALVGALLLFIRRRNKNKKLTKTSTDTPNTGWRQVGSAAEVANSTPVCEVGSREPTEVRGDHAMPVELDPNRRVHQLE